MRIQDYVADLTTWAVDNLYKNVRRVPEGKLEWKVEGNGRTILDQLQECAQSPRWTTGIIAEQRARDFDPAAYQALVEARRAWTTVEACKEAHYANLGGLLSAIRNVPDQDLDKRIPIPFAPEPVALSEILMFHYWNVTYHLGQIMFIQTLYGDQEMEF